MSNLLKIRCTLQSRWVVVSIFLCYYQNHEEYTPNMGLESQYIQEQKDDVVLFELFLWVATTNNNFHNNKHKNLRILIEDIKIKN